MNDKAIQASRLADQGLTFGPPPEWVIERSVPEASAADGAVRHLLSDVQIDITGEHAWSHRTISQAISSEGVNSIASFSVAFLPSFQRLIIHRVRLLRGDKIIDLADPEGFQLLRREPNLERRIYDGALTADLQLSDVRPGDALETWFTIVGSNPSLKGLFDASLALAFGVPVEETCLRLRAAASRRLVVQVLPEGSTCEFAECRLAPDLIDREWRVRQEPPFLYEDSPPPWWAGHKRVNIDDELTWSEIADLFRSAYALPEVLPADLEAEIRRIGTASSKPTARAIEALRFVQSSIRYLAVAIGAGGFEPREVQQIWTTRFGDCKDVSRLLSSMLVRLGVKASPALISTFGKDPDRIPDPHVYAFNHCIVRAEVDGVVRWLDPTISAAGGDFDRISQPDLGWALPLAPEADIEKLPASSGRNAVLESNERIVFGAGASMPVDLNAETVFRDWKADHMRAAIRRDGLQNLSEHRRKYYDQLYNGARIAQPIEFADDIEANEIKLTESYTLERAWRTEDGAAHFSQADSVGVDLQVLPHKGRKQPLWLGAPRRFRRTTQFVAPVKWPLNNWDVRVETAGLKGCSSMLTSLHSSKEFQLEFDYAITRSVIQPRDFDEFPAEYMKLQRGASVSLRIPLPGHKKEKHSERLSPNSAMMVVFFGIVALAVIFVIIRQAF